MGPNTMIFADTDETPPRGRRRPTPGGPDKLDRKGTAEMMKNDEESKKFRRAAALAFRRRIRYASAAFLCPSDDSRHARANDHDRAGLRAGGAPGPPATTRLNPVAPPPAITPDDCAAYGARLAAAIAKHPDLTVSVVALGTTKRGIAGWHCGVGRVWRVDDDGRTVVSPTPYLEIPPGVELPSGITEPHHIIRRSVMGNGPYDPEWFEAAGKTFAILMTHPLPDELEHAQDVDDLAGTITCGIAGWWLRP